ncbi:MAG: hypothetical protein Q9162_004184 [Coniocarpon cinnabarinum]
MNCPSRVDPEALPNGWNQNPDTFALQSNNEFSNRPNLVHLRDHRVPLEQPEKDALDSVGHNHEPPEPCSHEGRDAFRREQRVLEHDEKASIAKSEIDDRQASVTAAGQTPEDVQPNGRLARTWRVLCKFAKFIGPGFMVAVAYIDPGNYATDVAAGASYKYSLLVMILVSNIIAIFLQSLCIKLGSVTGLNLAENIKLHCPPWLNYILWFFAEAAIVATDIAEVLGTAIALNLLIKVPLVGGCAISIVDVLIILIFYRPAGGVKGLRWFEIFLMFLILGVVICFCIELSLIHEDDIGEIFRGFVPSHALIESQG